MSRWAWMAIAAAVVAGAAGPPARAQERLFREGQIVDPGDAAGQLMLAPGPAAVAPADGPALDPLRPATVKGVVGGLGLNNQARAAVGFIYLAPLWSFRDFQLAVPRGSESLFPVFGNTGHVDSQFAYAPRVNLDYYVSDMDFSVGGSGTFLNLTGRLDRQETTSGGASGQLTAAATLTLVSANLIEFSRQFAFLELFPKKDSKECLVDSVIELRIGTRYVALEQNYTGTLLGSVPGTVGANVATRFSTQTFRGLGLTTAAEWEIPVGTSFGLYSSARQSLLIGDNRRNSSVSVAAAGRPGFSDTLYDDRTVLVPVTELELGVDWGQDFADRLREGLSPPRFMVRVAAVAQFWGGLGPLSAGGDQGFRHTDLFLVGGYVQAGFRY